MVNGAFSILIRGVIDSVLSKLQSRREHNVDVEQIIVIIDEILNSGGEVPDVDYSIIRDLRYCIGMYGNSPKVGTVGDIKNGTIEKLSHYTGVNVPILFKGKKYKIINTGSNSDCNCAYRAIAMGLDETFGSNDYKVTKHSVAEGAKKLANDIKAGKCKTGDVCALLSNCMEVEHAIGNEGYLCAIQDAMRNYINENNFNVESFLNDVGNYDPKMFLTGMFSIFYMLAAIGSGRQIVLVGDNEKALAIYDPEKMDVITDNDLSKIKNDAVFVAKIHAHVMALIDAEGSRMFDNAKENKENFMKSIQEEFRRKIRSRISFLPNCGKATGVISSISNCLTKACSIMEGCNAQERYEETIKEIKGIKLPNFGTDTKRDLSDDEATQFNEYIKKSSEALVKTAELMPLFWHNPRRTGGK